MMNKFRNYLKVRDLGTQWWTYEDNNLYYLMCNDSIMATFEDKHSIEIFERDFLNDENINRGK